MKNKNRILAGLMALCCMQSGLFLTANAETTTEPSDSADIEFKAGDVDLSGKIDILDVISINRALVGKEKLSDIQTALADFNMDGKVDFMDSQCIMRYIVGLYDVEVQPVGTVNLSESVQSQEVEGKEADEAFITAQTGFYLNLFQQAEKESPEENILVSPYSVMQALAMTANGADGSTKAEMELALGGLPLNDLNQYLYTQRTNQPNEDTCKLTTANSIWYRNDKNRLHVLPEFLQVNADYYGADAFSAPFNDSTVKDINNWCSDKTDGMIPELIDKLDYSTVMCLINAVTFDAKWDMPYNSEYDVHEQSFTAWDGTIQTADMLCSSHESLYLADEHAEGFYKYYAGRKYAFAALLPEEGLSVEEYISGLTAESLQNTLANPEYTTVLTKMPKFSYDYEITLNNALMGMGMQEAFTPEANFSKTASTSSGMLYISEVMHKTHIDVTEEGTRAAAVTGVFATDTAVPMEPKSSTLDRPFVYMIVDMENHLPVFMGAVKSISN